MQRLANLLSVIGASAIAAAGCAPEVLIARSDSTGAGGGGGAPVAGTGGTVTSGTGDMPVGAAGGEGGAPIASEPARLLADSVADFSLVQGEHGWSYGYDGGSLDTFALMTRISVITTYVPVTKDMWDCWANDATHWTQLFQLGGHANGVDTSPPSAALLQRAVRRWVSNYAGDVVISGEVAKIDVVPGSNGVDASVYVDGSLIYTTFIEGEDGGGLSYEVDATLQVGSSVDFVLDPHESDDHHDLSRFTGVIARREPPPSP